jgi:hypothetical protein
MPRPEAPPEASAADEVQAAILRTLLYADVFDYPLTLEEIHHYLIDARASREAVQAALHAEPLRHRVGSRHGFYALRERLEIVAVRAGRRRHSVRLWRAARAWAGWLSVVPFVRLVAVSGALAMDNATAQDDIDFLIVTAPQRVWLARALCVLMVHLARLAGVRLCPNYVLAQTALAQAPRDLYIAHELAQMVPLSGPELYAALRAANIWARERLPQAERPLRPEPDRSPRGLRRRLQSLGEWALAGPAGDWLERWEQSRKQHKFTPAARASAAALLDADHVKGHFVDHGAWALAEYARRLQACGLLDAVPDAGRPAPIVLPALLTSHPSPLTPNPITPNP